jgi:hypothetical protein
VTNLTERKGACGASDLEHATKVIKQAERAHKWKTRRAVSVMKDGMGCPENNND